jgi:hypothetical protein
MRYVLLCAILALGVPAVYGLDFMEAGGDDVITFGGGPDLPDPLDGDDPPCEDTCTGTCSRLGLDAPRVVTVGEWFWVEIEADWDGDGDHGNSDALYGVQTMIDFDPTYFEVEDAGPTVVVEDFNFSVYTLDNDTGYYASFVARGVPGYPECVWCDTSGDYQTIYQIRVRAKKVFDNEALILGTGHGTVPCMFNTLACYEDINENCDPCPPVYAVPMRWERKLKDANGINARPGSGP